MDMKRTLNNGLSIPMVGLGVFQMDSGEETVRAVEMALEAGYRHIDTAAIYENEAEVGQGIRNSGIARKDIFLTTKLWNENMRQENVREAFEASIERLGVDYVDLYLIHWPVPGKFIDSYLVMEELYKEGKIKAIGVSNFQKHHLDALMKKASVVPAINQIERHPYLVQKELLEVCSKMDIAVEAYSPLGGSGAPLLKDPAILAIAEKYGKSPAQIILRWDIQSDVIVLPKSVRRERIEENFALDFLLLEEDIRAIDLLDKGKRYGADPDNFNF